MARYEDIVKAIIEQNDYYRLPQSRIEAILLKIKQVIEEEGGKAKPVKWIGVTTTEITDKSNVNPIVINGATVYAETGNIASYGDSEFIFRGDIWQAFGNMTGYIPDEGNTTDDSFSLHRKTMMIGATDAAEFNCNKKATVRGGNGVDIIGNENGVNIDKLNGYIPNTGNETSDNFVLKRKSLDVRAMNGNAVFMNQADKFLFNVKADKTMHYIQGNGGATPGNEVMTSDKVDTKLENYIPDTGDNVEGSLSITRKNGAITLTSANPTTQAGGNVIVSPDGGVGINGAGNLTLGMSGSIVGGCGGPINIASAGQGGITFNSNAAVVSTRKVALQLDGNDTISASYVDGARAIILNAVHALYNGHQIATLDDLVGYLQNNAKYQNLTLGSTYSQLNEHSDIALNNTAGSLSTTGTAQVAEFNTNAAGIAEIVSRETAVDGENIKLTTDIVAGKVTVTKYDSLDEETYTLFTVNDSGAYVGAASANTKVMTQADLDAALGNIEAVLNAIV